MLEFQQIYWRNLPHVQPPGATMFVTSLLEGAIPLHIQQQLNAEARYLADILANISDPRDKREQTYLEMKRLFGRWDAVLDETNHTSPRWLERPDVAKIVSECLKYVDGRFCRMIAYTVMPTHVHSVFEPIQIEPARYYSISKIMHSWKRVSAIRANQVLNRTGTFWHHENYDHYARDGAELERIVNYVKHNPVKAGLAKDWNDWQWTYIAEFSL